MPSRTSRRRRRSPPGAAAPCSCRTWPGARPPGSSRRPSPVPADSLGTVIVTGGASGLGAAVAAAVRDAGGTPVVLDVNEPAEGIAFERVDLTDGRAAEAA